MSNPTYFILTGLVLLIAILYKKRISILGVAETAIVIVSLYGLMLDNFNKRIMSEQQQKRSLLSRILTNINYQVTLRSQLVQIEPREINQLSEQIMKQSSNVLTRPNFCFFDFDMQELCGKLNKKNIKVNDSVNEAMRLAREIDSDILSVESNFVWLLVSNYYPWIALVVGVFSLAVKKET